MKKMRKLLPALAMLLVSAVMMSTASYAWFAMNNTVSASGMLVKAKSDQTYLLISETPAAEGADEKTHAAAIQTQAITSIETVSTTGKNLEVYPAALKAGSTNRGNIVFYTAVGTDFDDATAVESSKTDIASSALSKYVVKYTLYLTVADDAVSAENLKISGVTIEGDSAVSVVVATDDAIVEIKETTGEDYTSAVISGSKKITDESVYVVDVYVFYDGNETTVTTENANNLADTTVSISFSVNGVADAT